LVITMGRSAWPPRGQARSRRRHEWAPQARNSQRPDLLIDTHALLWALATPGRLPAGVRDALQAPLNTVYVSAASVWEIAIKAALGKVTADIDELTSAAAEVGFEGLSVTILQVMWD
jgi:hypothetical protein